ncbi:MAG: Rieske (2Fe-2S) protein [Gammaproteobacteria bacterium]|nr:MAG: Rieske (2Fe-2S) protein [Gammaproteobacteria bacterium]
MSTLIKPVAIEVSDLDTLQAKGVIVVKGEQRRIAVFADGCEVFAVENNCPHMGFPLAKGSVRDGILTCHWHQARFDLKSGCTFDLWADDVLRYDCWVDDGIVFVASTPSTVLDETFHRKRLSRGIEQNVGLVQAKSLLALIEGGAELKSIVAEVVQFASRNLNRFGEGMTRLGCVVNLYPFLSKDTAYQGLYYAIRQLAEEISSAVPRRQRQPLQGGDHTLAELLPWMRQWVQTRHRDGAERTLLTGINNLDETELAELVFCGASERLYADGGHHLEDCNKVFEFVDHLGSESAAELFPLVVPSMTSAMGREESTDWHHPIEIVEPLREVELELPELLKAKRLATWTAEETFTETLSGDDPVAIIEALKTALEEGAPVVGLAQQVSYVAALRLARFALSNEVTDWFNPQHTFIFTNGVYEAVRRSAAPLVVRAVFQGAIAVYMDRYLNVPPARPPTDVVIAALPNTGRELVGRLLSELDQRGSVEASAAIVTRYLRLELPFAELIDTLTLATVREDLDFHSLQVLAAGVNQCLAWGEGRERENILVGVVRNLAAHCPTRRAGYQTASIAKRLHRGERIYEG